MLYVLVIFHYIICVSCYDSGAGRVGRGVKGIARGGFNLLRNLARGPDDVTPPPDSLPPVRSANRIPLSVSNRSYSHVTDVIDGDYDDTDVLQ